MQNDNQVEGKLFLYEKPEVLAREDHSNLGITPVDAPFANTQNHRAIPLTMTEFRTAQKNYPIIFSSVQEPIPLAIVGVVEDKNLFLDDQQQWDPLAYVPAYLRCYPFAFAQTGDDQMAVVIDRDSSMVSDNPQYPFFDDADITEHTAKMRDFSAQFITQRRQTEQLSVMLVEKGLLIDQHVTYRPDGEEVDAALANYAAVDAEKLNQLSEKELAEMHQSGVLAAIHAHLFSLENWNHLLERRRQAKS